MAVRISCTAQEIQFHSGLQKNLKNVSWCLIPTMKATYASYANSDLHRAYIEESRQASTKSHEFLFLKVRRIQNEQERF